MAKIKFLQEEPATSDDFEGAHEQVAKALEELIASSETEPCMVALEGGLGSGKSTVLEILKEKFKNSNNHETTYNVFVFDCFKYQNGPIRRAFFERFSIFLKKLLPEKRHKEIDEFKLLATGCLEETESKNETRNKTANLVFAVFLPLSAASLLIIGHMILGHNAKADIEWYWYLFAPLALIPIVQVLLGCRYEIFRPDISSSAGDRKSRTILLSTANVTSSDLALYYQKFLKLLPKNNKVVIVLDNIDRLDTEKFLEVWADMEIFTKNTAGSPGWVIVPYAPKQLERAFKEQYKYPKEENQEASDKEKLKILEKEKQKILEEYEEYQEKSDKDYYEALEGKYQEVLRKEYQQISEQRVHSMTEEFINKWFTLRYRVPEILLSDWKKYFRNKWLYVFGNNEECEQVLRLYRRYKQDPQDITPRNIKHFINEVAIHYSSTTDQSIKKLTIAAYRLLINKFYGNLLNLFADENYTNYATDIISDIDENWQKNMAALHYNVHPNRAQQIMLAKPLKEAIDKISSNEFVKLLNIDNSFECFVDILEENGNFNFLEKVFICKAGTTTTQDNKIASHLNTKLQHVEPQIMQKPSLFVKAIIKVLGDADGKQHIQKLYNHFSDEIDELFDKSIFTQLLPSIDSMIPHVDKKRSIIVAPENLVDVWLAHREKYHNITIHDYTRDNKEGLEGFQHIIINWDKSEGKNFPWNASDILELGLLLPAEKQINQEHLKKLLGDPQKWLNKIISNNRTATQALYMLVLLYDKEVVYSPMLQSLLSQQGLTNFPDSDREKILVGLFALSIKAAKTSEYQDKFDKIDIAEHIDTIKKLLHTSCDYATIVKAFHGIESSDNYKKILAKAVRDGWYNSRAETLMQSYTVYKDLVDREMLTEEELWNWFMQDKEELANLIDNTDIDNLPYDLIKDAVSEDNPIHNLIKKLLVNLLAAEEPSREEWEEFIKTAPPVYRQAIKFIESRSFDSRALAEAIANVIEFLLTTPKESTDFDFLFACSQLLPQHLINSLSDKMRRTILTKIDTDNANIISDMVLFYKDQQSLVTPMEEAEVQGFLDMLHIIVQNPQDCLDLVRYTAKEAPEIARKSYIKKKKSDIREIFSSAPYYDNNTDILEPMEKICKAFRVKLVQKPPVPQETEDSPEETDESNS